MDYSKLFCSAVIAALLVACGDGETKKAANNQTVAEEKSTASAAPSNNNASNLTLVRVATDAKYPPFQYRDEKGQFFGIEMDLLNAIGKSQGLNMEFHNFIREKWHETLMQGHHDLWASAFYGNQQYPDDVAVSKPFMEAYIVVGLCDEKEGNANIKNMEQLKGKKLAVSKYYGQAMIDLAAKITGSPDNVLVTDTFYLSARELYNKKVDGVLGANYVLAYYAQEMKKEPTTRFLRVESEEPRKLVFLMKKDQTELLDKINKGIDAAQADGTLQSLQNKWLGNLKLPNQQ